MANKVKILLDKAKEDPLFFSKNILGIRPWSKQQEIIKAVMDTTGEYNKRTTIKSCHASGKSFVSGNLVLQFLYTYPNSIVITTAPTFRQVEKAIWKEVRSSYNKSNIKLGGTLLDGTPSLQIIKDQWYALGLSTNTADSFQGFHEENILVIVDEAAGVSEEIFTGIEGIITSKNARLLLIGNPTSTTGTFRKSFEEQGWNKITISAFDTPNFTRYNIQPIDFINNTWDNKIKELKAEIPYPNLITPSWAYDKFRRWGSASSLYTSRVLGQFDEQGNDSLIPLAWIETAIERNKQLSEQNNNGIVELGVDVAEFGRDSSIVAIKKGRYIHKLLQFKQMPIMEFTGNVMRIMAENNAQSIKVDCIGVGTGVEGRLEELGAPVYRVVASAVAGGVEANKGKYLNKRAQLYWSLREQLNPDNNYAIGLPDDDELIEELLNTRYKVSSSGKIQILPKEDIKKMIGRSPDKADSLMLACAPLDFVIEKSNKKVAYAW